MKAAQQADAVRSNRPEVEKNWHIIDAEASCRPTPSTAAIVAHSCAASTSRATPRMSIAADHVIVINVREGALHRQQDGGDKVYYKHTGHPGGIKETNPAQGAWQGKFPERVLEKAVERMIPRGPLGRAQMKALHLYVGTEHPHDGQKPAGSMSLP